MVEHIITSKNLNELISERNSLVAEYKELLAKAQTLESPEGKRMLEISNELFPRLSQLIEREKRHLQSKAGIVDIPPEISPVPRDAKELFLLKKQEELKKTLEANKREFAKVKQNFSEISKQAELEPALEKKKKELEKTLKELEKEISENEKEAEKWQNEILIYQRKKAEKQKREEAEKLKKQKEELLPLFTRKEKAGKELIQGAKEFLESGLKAFERYSELDTEFRKAEWLYEKALERLEIKEHSELAFSFSQAEIKVCEGTIWPGIQYIRSLIDLFNRKAKPEDQIKKPEPQRWWKP